MEIIVKEQKLLKFFFIFENTAAIDLPYLVQHIVTKSRVQHMRELSHWETGIATLSGKDTRKGKVASSLKQTSTKIFNNGIYAPKAVKFYCRIIID